jgi:hypothetical protein
MLVITKIISSISINKIITCTVILTICYFVILFSTIIVPKYSNVSSYKLELGLLKFEFIKEGGANEK